MYRLFILYAICCLSACSTFDKTNIPPGQTVEGLGFSFEAPTENNWFAAEYGTSNRIKLVQLNDDDSYTILVSINRGPGRGMYPTAQAHLRVFQRHKELELQPPGYFLLDHEEWIDEQYGHLCIRYSASAKDWRGRNKKGAALVDMQGLTCEHGSIKNVLISVELSHRYEEGMTKSDLTSFAGDLFSSLRFHPVEQY
jgi:hypothetical protein